MEPGYKQETADINWHQWSRVVEAAQNPRHRDAVQTFLAQADLSAKIPAALDEMVLAPRRTEGATGEQCAYILCNLGFASLVAGTRGSAEFAMACGDLVEQLGPDTPDLELRRHFLSTKGELLIAVLTDQPHLRWDKVGSCCATYLRALDQHLDALPGESVEQNAMAAFSFAAQFLSRNQDRRAVEHYDTEISQLVDAALGLASRLLPAFVSRMWNSLLPGKDAALMFHRLGALAEISLQTEDKSDAHAATGLKYIDHMVNRGAKRSAPDLERMLQIRAELLLAAGRCTDALEQAEVLRSSSDTSVRNEAVAIIARCRLRTAEPEAAAESLAQVAPSTEQALESWRTTWIGVADDGYWTVPADESLSSRDDHGIWRLQAVAAADVQDMQRFLEAANRSTGFFADSLAPQDQAHVDLQLVLEEVFERLADGAALLQLVKTGEGILTWVARKRDGNVSVSISPHRPNVNRLSKAHMTWSRAYFDSLQQGTVAGREQAAAFAGLMDELTRNWGDLLQSLIQDGVTQLILLGDDLVGIPLHATRIGDGNERLIDRMPVSYAPSLAMLCVCLARAPANGAQRKGIALRSLADTDIDPADALAEILEAEPHRLAAPLGDAFRADVAAARVLHIAARVIHDARRPFDSVLGAGSLGLPFSQLVEGLDLARCEVVSNLYCESALPSPLRAPGFDLATLFLAAGAGTVLASTWVTDDEPVAELARSFFRNWVTGQAPSAAFRDALQGLRSARPGLEDFRWAGMRLVGMP